jgi:hypothetical protein
MDNYRVIRQFLLKDDYSKYTMKGEKIDRHAFPVGSIYLNVTGVNPATELGYGTWTQVAKGLPLVGEL